MKYGKAKGRYTPYDYLILYCKTMSSLLLIVTAIILIVGLMN